MSIRLSGNYFERLLINIIPWTFFCSLVFYFVKEGLKLSVITFLISTAAFWLMDTLIIYFKFKNPKTLKYNGSLSWGERVVSKEEIIKITPITDKRYRWSFRMVEFLLSNGDVLKIIDKPQTFIADFSSKPSKTLQKLLKIYPDLKPKIADRKYI